MTESPPLPGGKPPLTALRWVFAIIGGLLMLFAGGCGLYSVGVSVYVAILQGGDYALFFGILISTVVGLVFAGVPAAFGYLIWWLSVKRGRTPAAEDVIT